jgi:hypothetical protein
MYSALYTIPFSRGVSRIVACPMITCLLGNPRLAPDDERMLRVDMIRRGFVALQTPVQGPTIFT